MASARCGSEDAQMECGWTRRETMRNKDVRAVVKTAPIQLKMREQHLRWYGNILRRPEDHRMKLALNCEAPKKRPRGVPRKRWKDVIKKDLAEIGTTPHDALDKMRWRQITRIARTLLLRGTKRLGKEGEESYLCYSSIHDEAHAKNAVHVARLPCRSSENSECRESWLQTLYKPLT
ncbi:unnamed protein product [Heligmosomoides polygyrus]|uniref:Reverse transcriptase n=1 Tax=Heligmosomoides polygyrus TaxID=6339 RepID=A0A183FVA1_HELPZ|nr:unnamed protein product [Heligmosomoides polygyrus]